MGNPTEVYQHGIEYWIAVFGFSTTPLLSAFITGPFFASLNIVSVFEYIEKRYDDRKVKLVADMCYVLRTIIPSAIVIFGHSAALALILNLNQNVTIVIKGCIGKFFTLN